MAVFSRHQHHGKEPNTKNLIISIGLNFTITLVEFFGGIISNSLALISDALHNLSDTFALFISYIALLVSKKSSSPKKTFGYKRIEILAALFNSTILIAVSVFLFYKAYERFVDPQPIKEGIMFFVAVIGLVANLISVFLLKKDSDHNLNIRSAYLHLLGDTLSSVAVVIGSVLIYYFKIYWVDPLLTVLIGLFILKETFRILKETVEILMEASPPDLDIDNIRTELEKLTTVANIHHIHAWRLTDSDVHFQCHADLNENISIKDTDVIRKELENILIKKFNINHVTIQMEYDTCLDKESLADA